MNEDEAIVDSRSGEPEMADPELEDPEATAAGAADPESVDPESAQPIETHTTLEVGLVRTVRIGPIMVASAVIFAIIAFVVTFFFPVAEGANYTVGQVAGFMAVIGAIAGLVVGAIVALILGVFAKRRTGSAIAVLTDVR